METGLHLGDGERSGHMKDNVCHQQVVAVISITKADVLPMPGMEAFKSQFLLQPHSFFGHIYTPVLFFSQVK